MQGDCQRSAFLQGSRSTSVNEMLIRGPNYGFIFLAMLFMAALALMFEL